MATQLFKDGESVYVETNRVQAHLQAGWSASDPSKPATRHPSVIYPPSLKLDHLPQPEAEKAVLEAMGVQTGFTPVNKVAPVAVVGAQAEPLIQKRRGRPPKAKTA